MRSSWRASLDFMKRSLECLKIGETLASPITQNGSQAGGKAAAGAASEDFAQLTATRTTRPPS